MRITIDARLMGTTASRGIGRYIEELVRAMVAQAPHHRYVLLVRDPATSPFQGNQSVVHVTADVPWYGIAEQVKMPGILAATRPDIIHIPHWNVPVLSGLPRVVTVHDLLLLSEPTSAKVSTRGAVVAATKRLAYRVALESALFRSRKVLVPTEWVATDIRSRFRRLKTPIIVTGEGMPPMQPSAWQDPATPPYLLYVGSAYPHKGLDSLLDAWGRAAMEHPTLTLKIAGERDVFMQRLEARATAQKLPRITLLGHVPDVELPALYAQALAFIFPSRHEGFGLPPLEAMAYGCPVLAAESSCLPEVLGREGVRFFRPGDSGDILRAIGSIVRDPQGARAAARLAAPILAGRHAWARAASLTLQAYADAGGSR